MKSIISYSYTSQIEVSPLWKTEYPDSCSTAIRYIMRKMATMEGRLVWLGDDITVVM